MGGRERLTKDYYPKMNSKKQCIAIEQVKDDYGTDYGFFLRKMTERQMPEIIIVSMIMQIFQWEFNRKF